jgi:hypothetical protein
MVRLMQTMHLSCTDTNTIFKWTKTRFHMTHVTWEFLWVRPKLFMSLWYVQCKPCTNLASRLALSLNVPNRAPPEPRHLGSLWYIWRKPSTNLVSTLTLSLNRSKRDFTWPTSTRSFIRCLQHYFWAYGTFDAKPCTNLALRVALSPNRPNQVSTWASSPRNPIECIQNDF